MKKPYIILFSLTLSLLFFATPLPLDENPKKFKRLLQRWLDYKKELPENKVII